MAQIPGAEAFVRMLQLHGVIGGRCALRAAGREGRGRDGRRQLGW